MASMMIGQGVLAFSVMLGLIGGRGSIIGHIIRNALEQSVSISLISIGVISDNGVIIS